MSAKQLKKLRRLIKPYEKKTYIADQREIELLDKVERKVVKAKVMGTVVALGPLALYKAAKDLWKTIPHNKKADFWAYVSKFKPEEKV